MELESVRVAGAIATVPGAGVDLGNDTYRLAHCRIGNRQTLDHVASRAISSVDAERSSGRRIATSRSYVLGDSSLRDCIGSSARYRTVRLVPNSIKNGMTMKNDSLLHPQVYSDLPDFAQA